MILEVEKGLTTPGERMVEVKAHPPMDEMRLIPLHERKVPPLLEAKSQPNAINAGSGSSESLTLSNTATQFTVDRKTGSAEYARPRSLARTTAR